MQGLVSHGVRIFTGEGDAYVCCFSPPRKKFASTAEGLLVGAAVGSRLEAGLRSRDMGDAILFNGGSIGAWAWDAGGEER